MLWYLRENVTARPPFSSPRPPSLLSLDRCYDRVFRPSFIHLLALRELGAVGVPFLAVRSLGDLFAYSMYCIMFISTLNWIIYRNEILLKQKKNIRVKYTFRVSLME